MPSKIFISKVDYDRKKGQSPFCPESYGGVAHRRCATALYNYLFARQHGGDFIFRIEDTDSNRFVPGAEEYILESFKWLGIPFDEGVSFGETMARTVSRNVGKYTRSMFRFCWRPEKPTSLSILLRSWKQSVRRLRISSTMLLPACRCAIH